MQVFLIIEHFFIDKELLSCFLLYNIYEAKQNNKFYKKFNKLSVLKKIIIAELILAKNHCYKNNKSFDLNDALSEIYLNLQHIQTAIINNEEFFSELYNSISDVISNTMYINKFKLNVNLEPTILYTSIIVKSIFYTSITETNNEDLEGFIQRNIFINNIKKNSMFYTFNKIEINIVNKTLKVIMLILQLFDFKRIKMYLGKNFNTDLYIKFNLNVKINYINRFLLQYSLIPFRDNNNYQFGATHLTLTPFTKKNNYQNSTNVIDTQALKILNKQAIYIDLSMLEKILTKTSINIIKKYNLPILDVNIINYEETINLLIDMLHKLQSEHIENISKKKFLNKLFNLNTPLMLRFLQKKWIDLAENEQAEILNYLKQDGFDKPFISLLPEKNLQKLKQQIEEINKDVQKLYYNTIIYNLKNLKYPVYNSFFYDFRGRIYPDSNMGFTYIKDARPFFRFEKTTTFCKNSLESSTYFNKVLNSDVCIPKQINTHVSDKFDLYFLKTCFLEIGKLSKKTIYKDTGLSIKDIVEKGIEMYLDKNNCNFKETTDYAYFLSTTNCLDVFFLTKKWSNISIIKDSTASTLQHWGTLLETKHEHINYLNLDGDCWFDPYEVIINIFKIKYKSMCNAKIEKILNRDALKKIIMTSNYNASLWKCKSDLLNYIHEKELNIDFEDIIDFITTFYNFLNNDLFNELYKKDKKEYIQTLGDELILKDANLNFKYHTQEKRRKELKSSNSRWIITSNVNTEKIDKNKTNIALNANIIHALDAELARWLITKQELWPVHDSFCVSIFNTHELMDNTNEYFRSKSKNNEQYSAFILI